MKLAICFYVLFPALLFVLCNCINSINSGILTKKAYISEIFFLSIVFAFFFGFRYDVGIDFNNYYESFVFPKTVESKNTLRTFEPFFHYLYLLGNKAQLTSHFVFMVSSFIQFFFFLYSFKDDTELVPYAIVFLFITMIFYYLNIIRQCSGYGFILCAYNLLSQKKYKSAFIFFLIASLFHRSSLIALGVYVFCVKRMKIDDWKVQVLIICISFLLQNVSTKIVMSFLNGILDNSFLASFISKRFSAEEGASGSGLGVLLKTYIYMVIIYLLKDKDDFKFTFYKRVFLFGAIILEIFVNSRIFQRIGMIFQITQIYLLSFLCYDYQINWKRKGSLNKVLLLSVIAFLFLLFAANLFGTNNQHCVPFQFNMGDL